MPASGSMRCQMNSLTCVANTGNDTCPLPPDQRPPASYRQAFLDDYRPTAGHLSQADLDELSKAGQMAADPAPAGTYARGILDRMLIDLSWNSSRLEGNTYSLLDTKRLFETGGRRPES